MNKKYDIVFAEQEIYKPCRSSALLYLKLTHRLKRINTGERTPTPGKFFASIYALVKAASHLQCTRVRPRVPPSFVRLVGVNCHALCRHKKGTLNRAWQGTIKKRTAVGPKKILLLHCLLCIFFHVHLM